MTDNAPRSFLDPMHPKIESASIVVSQNGDLLWKMRRDGKEYSALFEGVGLAGLDAAIYNLFQTAKALTEQEVS